MSKDSVRLVQMDEVVQKTIDAIEQGKVEIFEIAEEARQDCRELESRLVDLNIKIGKTIDDIERLEKLEKNSRYELMTASKSFGTYKEVDIREAYEMTKDLQVQIILQKKQEEQLILQRSYIEHQIKRLRSTLKKAEFIASHVASAMHYLEIALTNIDSTIIEVKKKEEMGIRIIMAQEEERQRVARDIHDGPAQSLSNLALKTELCEKLIEIDPDRAVREIRDLKKLVRGSLQEIRKIIFDLRPMSLDDLGLIDTLRQYINRFINDTGVDVVLDSYSEHIRIDSLVEVAVFRIIQEALNNVAKHANATQVFINLKIIEDTLVGGVIDNGTGFDVNNQKISPSKDIPSNDILSGGFGIYGMKQRADLLKGKLTVKSQIEKGTAIRLEIPINTLEKECEHIND